MNFLACQVEFENITDIRITRSFNQVVDSYATMYYIGIFFTDHKHSQTFTHVNKIIIDYHRYFSLKYMSKNAVS